MNNYGPGVSRVLVPQGTSYLTVIHQAGKPPTDAEINLLQDLGSEWTRIAHVRGTPSGWLGNETNVLADYQTSPTWSNWFKFGRQRSGETQSVMWAVVNGWLVPVTGTRTGTPPGSPNDSDTTNVIALDPPPSSAGDFRTDFVFLEVWQARLPPNPSTQNKPASSAVYRYGNVEGGYTFISDDLIDPALGFETTERVQLQYRIRVVKGLTALSSYPDGFEPAIKAQGTQATAPTSGGYSFTNMRSALGDPGLWRAGDGTSNSLGTVDGYVYAIPLCTVFRRNSAPWTGEPSPNLNGGFNRNPTATDRIGIKTFSTVATIATTAMTAASVEIQLGSTTNIELPVAPASPVLIKVGDELMTYSAIDTLTNKITGLTRGVNGSVAEAHPIGTTVKAVATRPDGLFADQVAKTDILDLRHVVNTNGFDYDSLLEANLDKLFRGQLRANWKRTGGGSQGVFVAYQDKIGGSSSALGVTKLDSPDGVRMVFSDAAVMQPVEVIVKPSTSTVTSPATASIGTSWSLQLTVNTTKQASANLFSAADEIVLPIAQFKLGVAAGDADQVRFVNDGLSAAVTVRVDGSETPLSPSLYTVTPANPTSSDDLKITLGGSFAATARQLYITATVMYGPGRGLSRRPDSIHSVAFISPNTELLQQPASVPSGNVPTRISWVPLWSKYRSTTFKNQVPVTAETYADLGSKTVALTPFRIIDWPDDIRTIDGTSVNVAPTSFTTGTAGSSTGTTTFTDGSKNFTALGTLVGDVLTIPSGAAAGSYVITVVGTTTLTVSSVIPAAVGISYGVYHAQGVMPLLKANGTTPKWTTTDPLELFSGTTETAAATKNLYVSLPRHLVPGWGEVRVPILRADTTSGTFHEGINFMCVAKKGDTPYADSDKNYVPHLNAGTGGGSQRYAVFSTYDWVGAVGATYNTKYTPPGVTFAGMRQFTDTRGLNRKGLELPPFYGVARLFGVYIASEYAASGSAYVPNTLQPNGSGAKNLLRQDFTGPTFWIEKDDDGDSTFILNADAIDISKATTPPANFAAGQYVIEAQIFGFDRGSFDITKPFRLVMTRPISSTLMRSQAADGTRSNNLGIVVASPVSVLPGPAASSDQIVVNYSRTPYQGDAFGSQANYIDSVHTPGSLTTATAFQISSTTLTESALTRPNQKVLEVLASVAFETTLGTGRLSGDMPGSPATVVDVRSVGYEDPSVYPPATGISARPRTLIGAFTTANAAEMNPQYLGLTDRLPLGALMRDKDFRGEPLGASSDHSAPLTIVKSRSIVGLLSAPSSISTLEVTEAALSTADTASGAPGEVIAHVDGEVSNYTLLTNYRTTRGGSAFSAGGDHPGGEVLDIHGTVQTDVGHTNVLSGRAFLVRNAVTSVGSTEVSAGDELMMLIVTTAQRLTDTTTHVASASISTNGLSEGYSAADLYRIEGRPLASNNIHMAVDPSTIVLTKRGS